MAEADQIGHGSVGGGLGCSVQGAHWHYDWSWYGLEVSQCALHWFHPGGMAGA